MYKNDVLEIVDHYDNSLNWEHYMSNPLTDAALDTAVSVLTNSNVAGAVAGVLAFECSLH